ncbi:MAG: threonine/serine exporter family protein, partial [Bifidobacterium mongoliense]|nr:threonine/serine exporter family protein [Bifidobacterium mongoliense]
MSFIKRQPAAQIPPTGAPSPHAQGSSDDDSREFRYPDEAAQGPEDQNHGHQETHSMDESVEAVSQYHTHSIPLDMEDIERDWDKPVADAGIAGKASVIVRVGMLDLGSGTGSFRVREMMHRIAFPLGVHVRADVNLTDIEASCTDGKAR